MEGDWTRGGDLRGLSAIKMDTGSLDEPTYFAKREKGSDFRSMLWLEVSRLDEQLNLDGSF